MAHCIACRTGLPRGMSYCPACASRHLSALDGITAGDVTPVPLLSMEPEFLIASARLAPASGTGGDPPGGPASGDIRSGVAWAVIALGCVAVLVTVALIATELTG